MATRNIVPRANDEGNIGTALKNWLKGWFKDLTVAGTISGALNGTVGGTTPADGSFTTLSATGDVTLSTHLVGGDGTTNPTNILTNGDFELWSAGASSDPDGWAYNSTGIRTRESTIKKLGTYSLELIRNGADIRCNQQIASPKGADYWQGRTITLGCWVYATVADRARISIYDNINTFVFSDFHDGDSTWQFLTVTHTLPSSSLTHIGAYLRVDTVNTTAYFDGAMLVEGAMSYAFSPKPLPRGGTITAETDETKFSHKIPVMIDGTLYYVMLTQS